ncbi:carbohydrate kinase family protein [Actinoallomurus sp. CA-150999]|uniref:carbohydrate kinase family protein n=1 Tax=Actinoallomurus sp. CA-150999 TaxID=3239887 RepID=UPI003D8B5C14
MSSTARPDLLVVGDANPDVLVSGAPETPPAGQAETLVDAGVLALGGSAAIVAHGAARLGLSTAFVGMVGRDPAGDFVLDTLSAAGVDISGCTRHESLPTALTVCLNRPDGDRAILTAPGCLPAFGPEHVPDVAARHVHAASYFLQPRLAAGLPGLLAAARAAGASTSLDTNDDPAGAWRLAPGLLAACDLLLPNEDEALALAGALRPSRLPDAPGESLDGGRSASGTSPQSPDDARGASGARAESADDLGAGGAPGSGAESSGAADADGGPRGRDPLADALDVLAAAGPLPVVKRGRRGVVARSGTEIIGARGPEVAPVDTVGAGDGFDAGFLAGWLTKGDLAHALAWGCACGALSTRAAGGTAAQAGPEEAAAFAARIQVGSDLLGSV